MFNNVAVDVFLGLTFVFLLYSLLATIIQEAIAAILNLRAAVLVKAVRTMLNDRESQNLDRNFVINLFQRIRIAFDNQWNYLTCHLPDKSLAKAFYKHPSIKYLSTSSLRSKPSYINPANFSSTLIKILRGRFYDGSTPDLIAIYRKLYPQVDNQLPIVTVGMTEPVTAEIKPETLDQLRQLYVDANQDIDKFKSLLEDWFNDTMDRANGWYKRQTKRILFFIGLFIALLGNVDTIKIYKILATNQTAREQMVQLSTQAQNKYSSIIGHDSIQLSKFDSTTYVTVESDVNSAGSILGIGWLSDSNFNEFKKLMTTKRKLDKQLDSIRSKNPSSPTLTIIGQQYKDLNQQFIPLANEVNFKETNRYSILGWLITALALTLGAPFWFDLLNKFMSLRSTGAKPTANDSNTISNDLNDTTMQAQPINVAVNPNTKEEEAVG